MTRDQPGELSAVDLASGTVTFVGGGLSIPSGVNSCPATASVPFADFTIEKAIVDFAPSPGSNDRFEVKGQFTLGPTSNGVDPLNEEVVVTVGPSSVTIPTGSFVPVGFTFMFEGNIGGSDVTMTIEATNAAFTFESSATGADLTDTANPVDISLRIGADSGAASIRMPGGLKFAQ